MSRRKFDCPSSSPGSTFNPIVVQGFQVRLTQPAVALPRKSTDRESAAPLRSFHRSPRPWLRVCVRVLGAAIHWVSFGVERAYCESRSSALLPVAVQRATVSVAPFRVPVLGLPPDGRRQWMPHKPAEGGSCRADARLGPRACLWILEQAQRSRGVREGVRASPGPRSRSGPTEEASPLPEGAWCRPTTRQGRVPGIRTGQPLIAPVPDSLTIGCPSMSQAGCPSLFNLRILCSYCC